MNTRFYAERGDAFELVFGQPISVGRWGGEFSVVSGSVWLTRRGDVEDHWLTAGHSLSLARGDEALVERLYRDRSAVVAWSPRMPGLARATRDLRLVGLRAVGAIASRAARLLGRLATGFGDIARRADRASVRAC